MQWWTRQQLGSRNPERRKAALSKLAYESGPHQESLALQALADSDAAVRLAAVEVIGQFEPDRAVACLASALGHDDPVVRERIAQSLGRLEREEAVEPLRQTLKDSQSGVRFAAARALQSLGWRPANQSDEAALAVARRDLHAAAQFGAAAVESLLTALADTTYPNRRAVVAALAETGDVRATKALIPAAHDPDPIVRVAAVEALGDLNEPAAAEAIRTGLRDSDPHVRAAAADSVGRVRDAGSVELLPRTLKDLNWEVRRTAVEAAGKLKDVRLLRPLIDRLQDADQDVRLAATEALGQLESAEAMDALVSALIDAHPPVRRGAETALRRIDPHWEQSAPAQKATEKLKSALKANDYSVRQAAADCLTKIGAISAAASTPGTLSHAALYRRQAAADFFIECLGNEDRDLRLAAVEALGRLADPRAHPPLSTLVEDANEDRWVHAAAEEILPKLVRVRPAPPLPTVVPAEGNKIVPLELWRDETKQRSR